MTTPATYNLIGAGGTGSILYNLMLRYLDTWHGHHKTKFALQVIDGDQVETKNYDRQLFGPMAVGKNKAAALVEASAFTPVHGKIYPRPEYLGKANIAKLIRETDTTLIAVDNYSCRALIEAHVKTLKHATVINGGNEMTNGSCQLYLRRKGKNLTPPLSHWHDEIAYKGTDDRAAMSCAAVAAIPGGEQTIIANGMSAITMLNMLRIGLEQAENPKGPVGHEVHFDLATLAMRHEDLRGTDGWK